MKIPSAVGSLLFLLVFLHAGAARAEPPADAVDDEAFSVVAYEPTTAPFLEEDAGTPRLWVEASASLRVGSSTADGADNASRFVFGGGLVLGGTFDDLLTPHLTPAAREIVSSGLSGAPSASDSAGDAAADDARVAPPAPPRVQRQGALATRTLEAARRAAGLPTAAERARDAATRARVSGLVPELRVRVARVVEEGSALAPTEYDPDRVTQSGGVSLWVEGRATFKLDRLVFADEEVALLRLEHDRMKLEQDLVTDVLRAFEAWQRAVERLRDEALDDEARSAAELDRAVAEAKLDALTGGWFSPAAADAG
ncbi:MAG: hypothetical protein U0271_15480 [Polyangiaceae bacterium]